MRIIFLRGVRLLAIILSSPLQRLMPDREKEPLVQLPDRFRQGLAADSINYSRIPACINGRNIRLLLYYKPPRYLLGFW
ncbi:hypothetical protein EMIT0P4_10135 [Pseudomonas sp. IT-P4]